MIPAWHRQKAGGPLLGARPGGVGPFGRYGGIEDAEPDEDGLDGGGLDGEDDQEHDDT